MNPLVGLSCNFFHPDPKRNLFKGKRLIYFEQQMTQYLFQGGAIPVGIAHPEDSQYYQKLLPQLKGLVLGGGVDMAPETYGEKKYEDRWPGDAYHDDYELKLIELARQHKIPILGICRGCQALNVAYGGTLYQDIQAMGASEKEHRNVEVYDELIHKVDIKPGTQLHQIFGVTQATINSVHHQAVKDVGSGLVASAISEDGIVEAVESTEDDFVVGVQWHPEWMRSSQLLSPNRVLEAFLDAIKRRFVQSP